VPHPIDPIELAEVTAELLRRTVTAPAAPAATTQPTH
jgi:hypothetical protein